MSQFQPGQSGNPVGRPKGSVNKQLKMLREAADQVLPLVLERALAGDADAQKLIIERGMPRMKPIAPPEPCPISEGHLLDKIQAVLRQVSSGELSTESAKEVIGILALEAKVEQDVQASVRQGQRLGFEIGPVGMRAYFAKVLSL